MSSILLAHVKTELATRPELSKTRYMCDLKDEVVRLKIWGKTVHDEESMSNLISASAELGETITMLLIEVASIILDREQFELLKHCIRSCSQASVP